MKLRIKFLDWSAGVPVAMLNTKTAERMGVNLKDRISIEYDTREIMTVVDTIGRLIKTDQIAVSSELAKELGVTNKKIVDVNLAPFPESLNFIKHKLNGKTLSKKEIFSIINDIALNLLSESEVALFVSASYEKGMSFQETIYLIKAILNTGKTFSFKGKVVDKHSIGGISGRTTPIVVSICAASGLIFPKTSSRAITTPAGTADSMETIAKVEFSPEDIKKIVKKTNACLVWGGGLGMVPADDKIISVEKMLNIDPEAQLLASIMSKKLSVGSKYILIHIPYGKTAKVNKLKALRLKKKFEKIGSFFRKKIICFLEENKGPIGRGVGPALEMLDVLKVLKRQNPCFNLEKDSLKLSAILLEMTGKAKKGQGLEMAKKILDSGRAYEKFKEIIHAQHGKESLLSLGKFKRDIFSKKAGKIIAIDNKKINELARISGCPADKKAGLYLHKHVGDRIKKGDKLITVYAESKPRMTQAVSSFKNLYPFILD